MRPLSPTFLPPTSHLYLHLHLHLPHSPPLPRRELERELGHAAGAERAALQQAIAQIDSGRMAARAKALHRYTVVGATCAATGLACMAGLHFDFVLLDECR